MAPMIGRCSGPHQQRHHLSIVLRTSQSSISATLDELPFEMNADSASAGALQVRETADCRHAGLASELDGPIAGAARISPQPQGRDGANQLKNASDPAH